MPEQTISPGVFTEERDQTFLQQGVQEIGGAFVGPTAKGPAFTPVEVDSPQEYENKFGNQGLYTDFAARNYLRDASTATVVRILGSEGYTSEAVEIQLPAGELSKREFQITRSNFDFGEDATVDPGQTVSVVICVGGRQERSSSDSAQSYDITIDEIAGGEYHATVLEQTGVEADCVIAEFQVDTEDFEEVQYDVTVELADGQTDTISSSAVQVDGFWLSNVDYNWDDGESRGEGEVLSLQGTVDNRNNSVYDYKVFEVINGTLQDTPVDEGVGIQTDTFEAFWEHNGSANADSTAEGDTLNYIVEVEQGSVTDVPNQISPSVEVFERPTLSSFELQDVNFNLDAGQAVDYGETVQLDLEASGDIASISVTETNLTQSTSGTISVSDQTDVTDDSSAYVQFDVGDSGIDFSTGDDIEYTVTVTEVSTGSTATETSVTVVLDEGVFQIGETDFDFQQGDDLGLSEFSGIQFEVVNTNSSDYDYDIIEVIDGVDQGSAVSGPITVTNSSSSDTVTEFVETNAVDGETVEYRIEVDQTSAQSGTIASADELVTPDQTAVNRTALGEFGIQNYDVNFQSGDVVETGDDILSSFDVDLDGATDFDWEIRVIKNGTDTGSTGASATGIAQDTDFADFNVGDSGETFYEGDTIIYQLYVTDGTNSDTFDSPEITFSGALEPIFQFDEVEFQFESSLVTYNSVEPNERLSVFFEVRTINTDQYRYEVTEFVDGESTGTVVADTQSEEGQTLIDVTGEDSDQIEIGWFNGATIDNSTVEYEVKVEELDASGNVTATDTATSGTLDVGVPDPKADVTLAVLAPTQRLRADGDEIYDAQINPTSADITDFELILDKTEPVTSSVQDHEPEDEVEELLQDSDVEPQDSGPTLIDGKSYQVSLQEGDSNYILDLFGEEAEAVREVYVKKAFPEVWDELITEDLDELGIDLKAEWDGAQLDFEDQEFDNAETPWIVSQDLQPQNANTTERQPLFRFETLGDGDFSNTELKVSIQNVRYPSEVPGSDYGTFDVLVRDFEDDDRNPDVIESFTGVNLNPDSSNYIAAVIGDRETVFTESGKLRTRGEYENRSDYIRVVVNPEVEEANENGRDTFANLVPWGFQAYSVPLDFKGQIPHGMKFRQVQSVTDAEYDVLPDGGADIDTTTAAAPFSNRIHFGVDFDWDGNDVFFQAIAENNDSTAQQSELSQEFGFVFNDAYVEDPNSSGVRQVEYGDGAEEGFPANRRKFSLGFQGGFDGKSPAKPEALGEDITATNTQGYDVSSFDAPGTEAYERAIGILGNEDQFDINLLVTPGIINDLHGNVVQAGINMVEDRADAFYVFDPTGPDSTIQDAIASVASTDSSYAATYFPWIRIRDAVRNKQIEVPPSVLIPRVYAFNDQTEAEWFAPAGFERGGIPEAVEAVLRLRREDRDELYANRVNPIAQFPDQGVSVWGQKTLQTRGSALDRVNVRRLLIRVKKFIASTSRFLVFEQNVPETRNRFKNLVNPFLDQVQQQNGLFDFRVKMDADNNPPEVIDRNQLVGEIFLQPTRTAEFIRLTFNVLPTGAEFEDL